MQQREGAREGSPSEGLRRADEGGGPTRNIIIIIIIIIIITIISSSSACSAHVVDRPSSPLLFSLVQCEAQCATPHLPPERSRQWQGRSTTSIHCTYCRRALRKDSCCAARTEERKTLQREGSREGRYLYPSPPLITIRIIIFIGFITIRYPTITSDTSRTL